MRRTSATVSYRALHATDGRLVATPCFSTENPRATPLFVGAPSMAAGLEVELRDFVQPRKDLLDAQGRTLLARILCTVMQANEFCLCVARCSGFDPESSPHAIVVFVGDADPILTVAGTMTRQARATTVLPKNVGRRAPLIRLLNAGELGEKKELPVCLLNVTAALPPHTSRKFRIDLLTMRFVTYAGLLHQYYDYIFTVRQLLPDITTGAAQNTLRERARVMPLPTLLDAAKPGEGGILAVVAQQKTYTAATALCSMALWLPQELHEHIMSYVLFTPGVVKDPLVLHTVLFRLTEKACPPILQGDVEATVGKATPVPEASEGTWMLVANCDKIRPPATKMCSDLHEYCFQRCVR